MAGGASVWIYAGHPRTPICIEHFRMGSLQTASAGEVVRLSKEVSLLVRLQTEALQRASYLHMSDGEKYAYDNRRLRIEKVSQVLAKARKRGLSEPNAGQAAG
jgi:hypothetical protein